MGDKCIEILSSGKVEWMLKYFLVSLITVMILDRMDLVTRDDRVVCMNNH